MPALDLTGMRYGRLVPFKPAPKRGKHTRWFCQCDCGNESIASTSDLRTGNTTSCGCYHLERLRDDRLKHGGSSRGIHGRQPNGQARRDVLYTTWCAIKRRCGNPKDPKYPRYGGRGIVVCERWADSFENFRDDMGPRPKSHSIERVDNDGPYSPENCIWASQKTQANNKSTNIMLEHEGRTICASDYAKLMGVSSKRLYKVMSTRSLSPQEAAVYVREHQRKAG